MKKIILAFLLLPFTANAENINCQIAFSTQIYSEKNFALQADEKITFEEANGFRFMLHHLGNSKFEIEVYNQEATTRSYANTFLRSKNDVLNWSFWSRSALVDVSCRL